MTATPPVNEVRTGRYSVPLFLALLVAGLTGNHFPFSILNAHFVFGSIAAMLALQIFGWGRGVIAAAVIAGYTYFAWNHPWAFVTMTAEAAVVGWLFSRRRVSLVMADLLYWLFIGIPLGYFCFHIVSDLPVGSALFLMTKQAINGVANALVARLIFTGFGRVLKTERISLRETLSNLLVLFVLTSSIVLVAHDARSDLAETDRNIRADLIRASRNVTDGLENWVAERKETVVHLASLAAKLPPAEMQARLEQADASDPGFLRTFLLDKQGTAVAYSPAVDELGRPSIGKSFADRPYWPLLRQSLKPMLSEVMPSRFGRTGTVAILLAPVVENSAYNGAVGGILNFDRIAALMETYAAGQELRYTLVDKNGNVIFSNCKDQEVMTPFSMGKGSFEPVTGLHERSLPPFTPGKASLNDPEEKIRHWIPSLPPGISTIELWGKSFYVAESAIGTLAEWKLILEQPVAPLQKRLYGEYSEKFFLLFAILTVSLMLAEFLSRRMIAAFERLRLLTIDLPARLASDQQISWPESVILETNHLIANVREMADSLREKFVETRRMNESLERRVEERTEELCQSEAFLRSILENIPDMIFMKDAASLRFVTFNRAGEELLGYSRDELLGKNDYDLFPKEEAHFFTEKDREVLRLGQLVEIPEEKIHTRRRGERILHTKKIPLFDREGTPQYLLGISEDITEKKKSYEALQEGNRKLLLSQKATLEILKDLKAENQARKTKEAELQRVIMAIEQAGEVVVITDAGGTIQYVNPAFETVTGYIREEAVGQNPRILKSGRQGEAFYRELWETISSGRSWEGRMVNKRKDGTLYTEDANISPVRDASGRIVNYVAVKRDITEHLRLADQFEQAQKMESVGRLAGGVAHDFNNMLGIILGYAEIALYEADRGTPLHENLTEIRKAAHRSTDLTRQLLAFARKQTIDPRVLNLNATVEGMFNMLRRLIGEHIDLAWLPGADLWPVKMDPAQIDQILANLCVNARDAIADVGKVTIETENVSLDEAYCAGHAGFVPGEYVMLAVSDNGCGMDDETMRNLFEPFFTTKGVGKGTGLGLSTVYGIVKQNDGFINVTSEPGRGTTFKITIPRHAGSIVEASAASAAELPQGHGETLLLVEDEPALLNMGKEMLEKLGYTVLSAGAPRDAMRLADEHAGEIHLLMTDVVMPEMNGRDLAERLLANNPGMKCLFMSGYTADVIARHGALDEGVHFIQKPFSMGDLAVKVRGMMNDE
jgi:two-component system, cell cycle sensor histidine kinase and response regulator CckA